jgi:drug/metabolite transporter (DMT)-like permease
MLVAAAALLWSLGGLIVRMLDAADVWTTVFWRSAFAASFILGFVAVRDRGRAVALIRAMGVPGLVVGACFAISSICFVIGLSLTTVANTLILFSTAPLLAALLGWLVLGERVRGRSWLAIGVAFCGVAVMVSESGGRGALAGDLVAFLVAVSFAGAIVMIRKYRHVRMTPATGLGAVMAMLVAWPLAAPLAVTGPDFALLFVFGSVQFGAGLALFATGARLAPTAEVGLVTLLEPLLGPIWVWVVLGADPGAAALIGGGIVLAALVAHTALDIREASAGAVRSAVAKR